VAEAYLRILLQRTSAATKESPKCCEKSDTAQRKEKWEKTFSFLKFCILKKGFTYYYNKYYIIWRMVKNIIALIIWDIMGFIKYLTSFMKTNTKFIVSKIHPLFSSCVPKKCYGG